MQILIFIALVIAIVAVIFALQNLAAVTVTFLFWSIHGSLALVLLVTLAGGVLISLLASMPGLVHGKWTSSGQKKTLVALEAERNTYKSKAENAEKEVKDLEVQLASLSAELEKNNPDQSIRTS
ncbi:MAG TPA: lipopolysaccharide assembly protein LapA domain-containing protein [Anaerolineaceae bacterium]|jgi:uncharacterized integral membrane protein